MPNVCDVITVGNGEHGKERRKEGRSHCTALIHSRLNSQAEVQSYRVLALQKGDQNHVHVSESAPVLLRSWIDNDMIDSGHSGRTTSSTRLSRV